MNFWIELSMAHAFMINSGQENKQNRIKLYSNFYCNSHFIFFIESELHEMRYKQQRKVWNEDHNKD